MRGALITAMAMIGVSGAAIAQPAAGVSINPERAKGSVVRVELVGDSTQSLTFGYGAGFCANFTKDVDCVDAAIGGTSSKTFRALGDWKFALDGKPDYMVIQFGHNDAPTPGHMPRESTMEEFEANMRSFVTEARAAGIKPVLVTPLARRRFGDDKKIHDDLEPHSEIVRKIAKDMDVPLIDLHADSVAFLNDSGPSVEEKVGGRTRKTPDGKTVPDFTHLKTPGGYFFGRMVAVDLGKAVPALAKYIKPEAAKP
jgi:lysophospholipase L1-like esterase